MDRLMASPSPAPPPSWVRAGSGLAEKFPGFLGPGWVRPREGSDEWHMLYRFDSEASLARWEASEQRTWWLGSAQGIVGESRRELRMGILAAMVARQKSYHLFKGSYLFLLAFCRLEPLFGLVIFHGRVNRHK